LSPELNLQLSDEVILSFYSHISRQYTSSLAIITGIIFGWMGFIPIFLALSNQEILSEQINLGFLIFTPSLFQILITIACLVFLSVGFFFYSRMLLYGRWLTKIEKDRSIKNYKDLLPITFLKKKIMERKDPAKLNIAEKVVTTLLLLYFIVPLFILLII